MGHGAVLGSLSRECVLKNAVRHLRRAWVVDIERGFGKGY
jgi:hypothetical protein